jgi:uncharacterized repeat protein (TIGR01451 family)
MQNPFRKQIKRLNTISRRIGACLVVLLALALPAFSLAAETVKLAGSLGVANVTAGDMEYHSAVNASDDQVVKFQVTYRNTEAADSGKDAANLKIKLAMPENAGKAQKITATISADNGTTVTTNATVNLNSDANSLQYIPGSATWRHNTGTADAPKYAEVKVADSVVTSSQGLQLERAKPGEAFTATLTVLAQVKTPGIDATKQVRVDKAGTSYATANTANPGDSLLYRVVYTNKSGKTQENVVMSDDLPNELTYEKGSTRLFNAKNPGGMAVKSDAITGKGIDIGSYADGANAYVTFKAKIPAASALNCGETVLKNTGAVSAKDAGQRYASATTTVTKTCAAKSGTPAFSCDLLAVEKASDREVKVTKFDTTAKNGAKFKNAVVDWGDGSDKLTTDKVTGKTHTYTKDGTYTVSATAHFTVDGKDKTSATEACKQQVIFAPAGTTPTAPQVEGENSSMPSTGPGDVIALFLAACFMGAGAYYAVVSRRLTSE